SIHDPFGGAGGSGRHAARGGVAAGQGVVAQRGSAGGVLVGLVVAAVIDHVELRVVEDRADPLAARDGPAGRIRQVDSEVPGWVRTSIIGGRNEDSLARLAGGEGERYGGGDGGRGVVGIGLRRAIHRVVGNRGRSRAGPGQADGKGRD